MAAVTPILSHDFTPAVAPDSAPNPMLIVRLRVTDIRLSPEDKLELLLPQEPVEAPFSFSDGFESFLRSADDAMAMAEAMFSQVAPNSSQELLRFRAESVTFYICDVAALAAERGWAGTVTVSYEERVVIVAEEAPRIPSAEVTTRPPEAAAPTRRTRAAARRKREEEAAAAAALEDSANSGGGCVVCEVAFRRGEKAVVAPCTHEFHVVCHGWWVQLRNECPECGGDMPAPTEPREVGRPAEPVFLISQRGMTINQC